VRDALAVADAVGVERAAALDALGAGLLGGVVQRLNATGASFAVALGAKDARLALRETQDAPVLSVALRRLEALPDQEADLSALGTQ